MTASNHHPRCIFTEYDNAMRVHPYSEIYGPLIDAFYLYLAKYSATRSSGQINSQVNFVPDNFFFVICFITSRASFYCVKTSEEQTSRNKVHEK